MSSSLNRTKYSPYNSRIAMPTPTKKEKIINLCLAKINKKQKIIRERFRD